MSSFEERIEEYKKKTRNELKNIAKRKTLKGLSLLTKDELAWLIVKNEDDPSFISIDHKLKQEKEYSDKEKNKRIKKFDEIKEYNDNLWLKLLKEFQKNVDISTFNIRRDTMEKEYQLKRKILPMEDENWDKCRRRKFDIELIQNIQREKTGKGLVSENVYRAIRWKYFPPNNLKEYIEELSLIMKEDDIEKEFNHYHYIIQNNLPLDTPMDGDKNLNILPFFKDLNIQMY